MPGEGSSSLAIWPLSLSSASLVHLFPLGMARSAKLRLVHSSLPPLPGIWQTLDGAPAICPRGLKAQETIQSQQSLSYLHVSSPYSAHTDWQKMLLFLAIIWFFCPSPDAIPLFKHYRHLTNKLLLSCKNIKHSILWFREDVSCF